MPIYDYKCNDCKTTYDVFHKVREVIDDVVCPSCESKNHTRLLSVPNVSMSGIRSTADFSPAPTCDSPGGCCGGACEVN
ncbi:MAG: zinc ribbon domain-containing protein [Bacteroidota bacterium]